MSITRCVTRDYWRLSDGPTPKPVVEELEFEFDICPGSSGGPHEPPSGPDIDLQAIYVIRGGKRIRIGDEIKDEYIAAILNKTDLDDIYDAALEPDGPYDDDSHPDY